MKKKCKISRKRWKIQKR